MSGSIPKTFCAISLLLVLALASACASHHPVRCDSKLEAINPPHAKLAPEAKK
jgi:hypothetical protein